MKSLNVSRFTFAAFGPVVSVTSKVLAKCRRVYTRVRSQRTGLSQGPFNPRPIFVADQRPLVSKAGDGWLVSIPASPDDSVLGWMVPSGFVVEAHGHCLAFYGQDGVKVGEAFVCATGPAVVKECGAMPRGEKANRRGQLIQISAKGPHKGMDLCIRNGNYWLQDRGLVLTDSSWRRWHAGERSLSYLLENPRTTSGRNHLVVVFSAIGSDYDFTYNYRTALSGVDAYRLFVLDDFGTRGSYYLADHKDLGVFHSTQAFLSEIIRDLAVDREHVTFAGSSKGGTAALIHGLPQKVGNIVAGAPQSKPGTYLGTYAQEILQFMTGEEESEGRKWLDTSVHTYLSQKSPATKVRVLVGDADHHLDAHVRPLEGILTRAGTPNRTLVVQGVSHQDIGKPFSLYLDLLLKRRTGIAPEALVPYELSWQHSGENRAQLKVWIPRGEVMAIHIFSGNDLLVKYGYSSQNYYSFTVPEGQRIRVRMYRRSTSSRVRKGAFTTEWLRPAANG